MKKRRIFKDWVSYTLIITQICLIMIFAGECEGCTIAEEMTIKLAVICILIINHILIARHSEFYTNAF